MQMGRLPPYHISLCAKIYGNINVTENPYDDVIGTTIDYKFHLVAATQSEHNIFMKPWL